MEVKYSFLDLNAQFGGTANIFEKLGFHIAGLYEPSAEAIEYANIIHPELLISPLPDSKYIPYADVLFADISKMISYSSTRLDSQNIVADVILRNFPKVFILKTSIGDLRNERRSILPFEIMRRYSIFYQVFKESEFSGFPVKGNQIYIVGVSVFFEHDIYRFPESPYSGVLYKNVYEELERDPDPWYRRLPRNLSYDGQLQSRSFYLSDIHGRLRQTDVISTYTMTPTYFCDNMGLRKFTHNEYAMLKGYPQGIFNNCKNKYKTYSYIASLSNLYIIEVLAKSVLDFLQGRLTQSSLKRKDGLQTNRIEQPPRCEYAQRRDRPIYFPKNRITNITIDNLKGLSNLSIDIEKNLVAVMGVNGVGKSTVLHALACSFSPFAEGADNYKFSFFFTPNTDALWDGSKLSIGYYDENTQMSNTRGFEKKSSRWWPRYSDRPKKNVYYLGIATGIPEIEKERQTTFIDYSTVINDEKHSSQIIRDAADILNKDYKHLTVNQAKNKSFVGVCTGNNLKYTSLSMGAGEQRLFKILQLVYTAPTYSLILIDEIDLLLHVNAQKRLIRVLYDIATRRNLQIIFTTHSLDIAAMNDLIDIRYLYQASGKTMVYNKITHDMIFDIRHEMDKPIEIYVEDDLSKTVIMHTVSSLGLSKYTSIKMIGVAENIFVMAAANALDGQDMHNKLFVLDGDVKSKDEEKLKSIKKHLTGTESHHDEKIAKAMSAITQFNLPQGVSPERYLHSMIVGTNKNGNKSEIVSCACEINAVGDSHEWINNIISCLDLPRDIALYRIIDEIADGAAEWEEYIQPVREWLISRREELCIQ